MAATASGWTWKTPSHYFLKMRHADAGASGVSAPRPPCATSIEFRANCAELNQGAGATSFSTPFLHLRRAPSRTALLFSVALCAWLAIAKPIGAQSLEDNPSVDMSALSCADLLRMPLPEALIVVGWIGGFYAGLRNDPRVQLSIFADDADRILNLCRTNQSTSVMTLVERTFGLVRPPTRQGAQ